MNSDFIKIGDETYYLDIDAIMNWCLVSGNNPTKETEINEGYDTNNEGDIQMMTKVVRELKTSNTQDDTIRYDFIKLIIAPFLGDIIDASEIKNNLSYTLLFNTLLNMKFLAKINK